MPGRRIAVIGGKLGSNTGSAGTGRPKGSRNRTTSAAKAIIEDAVEGSGGADRLLVWAKESPNDERVFWSSIFPKLPPLQVTWKDENPVQFAHRVVIAPEKRSTDVMVQTLASADR